MKTETFYGEQVGDAPFIRNPDPVAALLPRHEQVQVEIPIGPVVRAISEDGEVIEAQLVLTEPVRTGVFYLDVCDDHELGGER